MPPARRSRRRSTPDAELRDAASDSRPRERQYTSHHRFLAMRARALGSPSRAPRATSAVGLGRGSSVDRRDRAAARRGCRRLRARRWPAEARRIFMVRPHSPYEWPTDCDRARELDRRCYSPSPAPRAAARTRPRAPRTIVRARIERASATRCRGAVASPRRRGVAGALLRAETLADCLLRAASSSVRRDARARQSARSRADAWLAGWLAGRLRWLAGAVTSARRPRHGRRASPRRDAGQFRAFKTSVAQSAVRTGDRGFCTVRYRSPSLSLSLSLSLTCRTPTGAPVPTGARRRATAMPQTPAGRRASCPRSYVTLSSAPLSRARERPAAPGRVDSMDYAQRRRVAVRPARG